MQGDVGIGLLPAEAEAIAVADGLAREIIARDLIDNGGWETSPWSFAFLLAQRLQGIDGARETFELDPDAFRDASDIFWRMLIEAGQVTVSEEDEEHMLEDKFADMVAVWPEVRVPGGSSLVAAFREAETHPIELLPPIPQRLGWRFKQVMSTAYHLQKFRGDEAIILPVRPLGLLLRTADHTPVGRFNKIGERYKLLVPVDSTWRYATNDKNERKAKTYKFN